MTRNSGILLTCIFVAVGGQAASETFKDRHALKCPAGSKLTVLEGEGNKAEFCGKGKVLHGPAREWYPNGTQRTLDNWSDGKKSGLWIEWDEMGVKRGEHCYRAGELNGRETLWHANSKRASLTHYKAGLKSGPIAQWALDGMQIAAGQFLDGESDGVWTFRDPKTHETFSVTFDRGKKVGQSQISAKEFTEWVETPARCDGAV